MYKRSMTLAIERLASHYPVVGITGPRQSGKTTLARTLFSHLPYVSLENLDVRLQAQQDPRSFLGNYVKGSASGVILDEVQHVPELLSYLQGIVDEHPEAGRFVITGSQNFAVSSAIAQSLSGRIGMVTLLPLSLSELHHPEDVSSAIFHGGYPRLHQQSMSASDFYPSYIQTYLERDIRQLKKIENLGRFQNFLKLCAGRIGQLVNFSSLAQDAGVSHTTARAWLNLLEASYILFTLHPHHQNFNKRLVKMPKLYFYDTGLACSLLGLEQASQLTTHYMNGALFENLVVLEVMKGRMNCGLQPNLYFWRDQTGHEVDLIAEWGGALHALEVKRSATFQTTHLKNLHYLIKLGEAKAKQSLNAYLVYTGVIAGEHDGVTLVPLSLLDDAVFSGGSAPDDAGKMQ